MKVVIHQRKVKYVRIKVDLEAVHLIVPEDMEIKPDEILERYQSWIKDKTEKIREIKEIAKNLKLSKQDDFHNLVYQFVDEVGEVLKTKPNKVLFRKMKKRWGSCNPSKKIVIFNTKMAYLPKELIRYVVVHELCHLLISNHRKEFWLLVEMLEPHFREKEKTLGAYNLLLD